MRSHLARQKHLRLVLTPSEPQVVLVPKDLSPQGPGFPANAAASDLLPQSQPSWTALMCQQPWELGEVGANKPNHWCGLLSLNAISKSQSLDAQQETHPDYPQSIDHVFLQCALM